MKTLRERFEEKYIPEPNSGCWLWIGGTAKGYGVIHDGRQRPAHQIAWELEGLLIPDGLELDHKCRNRCCVNPAHLEPVTHGENMRRWMRADGFPLKAEHCVHGHLFDERNTRVWRGSRICRACDRRRRAEYYQRRGGERS